MDNTISSIYASRDYVKKSERKKLIKAIIESNNDERLVDCYEYFNDMYTAISISNNHLVWSYDFSFSSENVEYSINIMTRNYRD